MARSVNKIDVYLEAGKKQTFAGALDWPMVPPDGMKNPRAALSSLDPVDAAFAPLRVGVQRRPMLHLWR
jgi:hypothetical protein